MTAGLHALLVDDYFRSDGLRELLAPEIALIVGEPADAGPETIAVITVDRPLDAAELAHATDVRLVVVASVGFEHVDITGFHERGVAVCHTPTYCTEEVASHTLAAILALLRGLMSFDRATQANRWDIASGSNLRRIEGTKLGIVGLGRIGRSVAGKAMSLGMEVIATDHSLSCGEITTHGVRPVPLHELLVEADIVTLHAYSDPGAPPIIGAEELGLLGPRSMLVNTARAALVDLDALARSLNDGSLGAAHCDVWAAEPPDREDPRLHARNLFLSPHAAWVSADAERTLWRQVSHAVIACLNGQDVPHRLP